MVGQMLRPAIKSQEKNKINKAKKESKTKRLIEYELKN